MKRIFLIGNGPSLNVTPLDDLIGEDSFGLNRIHFIYDKVKWRPTYFYYVDHPTRDYAWADPIEAHKDIVEHMWLLNDYCTGLPEGTDGHEELPPEKAYPNLQNVTWMDRCKRHHYYAPGHPKAMSEWHFPEICTAMNGMSGMIQIAVQLGYEEIYLLGCDLGYTADFTHNHFDERYVKAWQPNPASLSYIPTVAVMAHVDNIAAVRAHEIAKAECAKRGVKIYNATIGGQLEVYPRIDLKDVLNGRRVL